MRISYDEFRARFSDAEKVKIELAQQFDGTLPKLHPSNVMAASLRALIADAQAAGSIGLDSPRVVGGVQMLASAGLLDEPAADRVVAILALPAPQPDAAASEWPPVGGFAVGQAVRCVAPWSETFPGEFTVAGFGPECVVLSNGASMAPSNVEAV